MSKAPSCKRCGGPCRAGELTAQQSPVEAAHAAGRAEAVADIRKVLHDLVLEHESLIGGAALLCAIDRIKSGAHVGAAKKGSQ